VGEKGKKVKGRERELVQIIVEASPRIYENFSAFPKDRALYPGESFPSLDCGQKVQESHLSFAHHSVIKYRIAVKCLCGQGGDMGPADKGQGLGTLLFYGPSDPGGVVHRSCSAAKTQVIRIFF